MRIEIHAERKILKIEQEIAELVDKKIFEELEKNDRT